MASKAIGEKMKKKEPPGDSDSLEAGLVDGLASLSLEQCSVLTVTQVKRIRTMIDTAIEENGAKLAQLEVERDNLLRREGAHFHPYAGPGGMYA
jgi:seryl-tRNA synthetase